MSNTVRENKASVDIRVAEAVNAFNVNHIQQKEKSPAHIFVLWGTKPTKEGKGAKVPYDSDLLREQGKIGWRRWKNVLPLTLDELKSPTVVQAIESGRAGIGYMAAGTTLVDYDEGDEGERDKVQRALEAAGVPYFFEPSCKGWHWIIPTPPGWRFKCAHDSQFTLAGVPVEMHPQTPGEEGGGNFCAGCVGKNVDVSTVRTWDGGGAPRWAKLEAACSPELLARVKGLAAARKARSKATDAPATGVGNRNNTAYATAIRAAAASGDRDEVRRAVEEVNSTFSPSLSEAEAEAIVKSALTSRAMEAGIAKRDRPTPREAAQAIMSNDPHRHVAVLYEDAGATDVALVIVDGVRARKFRTNDLHNLCNRDGIGYPGAGITYAREVRAQLMAIATEKGKVYESIADLYPEGATLTTAGQVITATAEGVRIMPAEEWQGAPFWGQVALGALSPCAVDFSAPAEQCAAEAVAWLDSHGAPAWAAYLRAISTAEARVSLLEAVGAWIVPPKSGRLRGGWFLYCDAEKGKSRILAALDQLVTKAGGAMSVDPTRPAPSRFAYAAMLNGCCRVRFDDCAGNTITSATDYKALTSRGGVRVERKGGEDMTITRAVTAIYTTNHRVCGETMAPDWATRIRTIVTEQSAEIAAMGDDWATGLTTELTTVAAIALAALSAACRRGSYTTPPDVFTSQDAVDSDVAAFVEECLEPSQGDFLPTAVIWPVFKEWAAQNAVGVSMYEDARNGDTSTSNRRWQTELQQRVSCQPYEAVPGRKRPENGGNPLRGYLGITFKSNQI